MWCQLPVEHALSCPKGGFPSIRQNIRDLTANLLTEVCGDVCIEPELQSITQGIPHRCQSNGHDGARLDIASGFCGGRFEFINIFHNNFIQASFYYLYLALYLDNTESDNKTLTFSSSSFSSSLHGVTEHTVASRYNQLHTCRGESHYT